MSRLALDPLLVMLVLLAAAQFLLAIATRIASRARRRTAEGTSPPGASTESLQAMRSALRPRLTLEITPAPPPPPAPATAEPQLERGPRAAPAVAARRGMVWATVLGSCRAWAPGKGARPFPGDTPVSSSSPSRPS